MHARRSRRSGLTADQRAVLEPLERRQVLAASVNVLGQLTVTGTDGEDTVIVAPGPSNGQVVLTGVPDVPDGTVFEGVTSVVVALGRGNDIFSLEGDLTNPSGGTVGFKVDMGFGGDTAALSNTLGTVVVAGGAGPDVINGGPSADRLRGGRGNDTIFGGGGDDILEGKIGADNLFGNTGNDILIGGPGPDGLFGNGGADTLRGGTQGDLLLGGAGPDLAFGNIGRDTFFVSPGEARDFRLADTNFNVLFNPSGFGVLPNDTFWERFAGAEDPTTGIIDSELVAAMRLLTDAFPQVVDSYRTMLDDVFLMDTNQRQTTFQAFLGVTNTFSPSVLANPAGFTQNDLIAFRDDLNAAAPDIGNFRASFVAYNLALFDAVALPPGLAAVINDMDANASDTQSFLFAADSLFNLLDELNQ